MLFYFTEELEINVFWELIFRPAVFRKDALFEATNVLLENGG